MASFPDRLKYLRGSKGWKQKDIADRLGITESAYGFYEQGKREGSQETLQKLADIYEETIDYIVGRTDVRNNSELVHEEPIVQILMRGKDQMSPNNYELFTKAVEELKKAFVDKVDRELDGDKK